MEFHLSSLGRTRFIAGALARGLIATAVVAAIGWGGAPYAANPSVQGAKKTDDAGFDGDAPTPILIEAASGSVLFGKKAHEPRAPPSLMKLRTARGGFKPI